MSQGLLGQAEGSPVGWVATEPPSLTVPPLSSSSLLLQYSSAPCPSPKMIQDHIAGPATLRASLAELQFNHKSYVITAPDTVHHSMSMNGHGAWQSTVLQCRG